jgi:micrococcal nuclease
MPGRRSRSHVSTTVLRQLRRRSWTRRSVITAIVLIVISIVLDRLGTFRYRGDDWEAFDRKTFTVSHVVDGDTVRIQRIAGGEEETIRLLGIDAPEIAHSRTEKPDHWGNEATSYLETIIEGKPVVLHLDTTQTRDKYRRLLAYLYVGEAENINLSLVRDGQAYAHRDYAHSMKRQFEQAEDEARGKSRGLWQDVSEKQMPPWRQRWLETKRK